MRTMGKKNVILIRVFVTLALSGDKHADQNDILFSLAFSSFSINWHYAKVQKFIDLYSDLYHFNQRNGQRVFGPPKSFDGEEPSIDCEIFIGRLPKQIFEDTLLPILWEINGTLYNLRILMDFDGGNRGFAFARFMEPESARKACKLLNHKEIIPGQFIGCMMSRNNNEIIIGNLSVLKFPPKVIFNDLMQLDNIIKRIKFSSLDQLGKYYVIVEFNSHRDAALSRRVLIAHRYENWRGKTIVDWASKHLQCMKYEPFLYLEIRPNFIVYQYTNETPKTILKNRAELELEINFN